MKKNILLTGLVVLLLSGCVTTENKTSTGLNQMYIDGELTQQELAHLQMNSVDRYKNMVLVPTN